MTPLTWLEESTPLPHPSSALPEGLLAVGGSLTTSRLAEAYSKGIFPWFSEGDPILWWSPDPRMVLACDEFRASRSLRKKLRQIARREQQADTGIRIRLNTAFEDVIQACAGVRSSQVGTWISPDIRYAYSAWHHEGRAHSIETWIDDKLAGGLYGVSLGGLFFGESMFSNVSDASKIALAYLVAYLKRHGVSHIDCQQQTNHLSSLGAAPISRTRFLVLLDDALEEPSPPWGRGQLLQTGELAPVPAKTP